MQINILRTKEGVSDQPPRSNDVVAKSLTGSSDNSGYSNSSDQWILPRTKLSQEILECISLLKDSFGDTSLFFLLKDVLDELVAFEGIAPDNTTLLSLVQKVKIQLAKTAISQPQEGVSAASVETAIQLFTHSDELKLDFLDFLETLEDNVLTDRLKTKITRFIDYLDAVSFMNQNDAPENNIASLLLYFPLSVATYFKSDKKAELMIYPKFDEQGKVRQDMFSFGLTLDTDTMGKMKIDFDIYHHMISCRAVVENWRAKELAENNMHNLFQRLKTKNFYLKSFVCDVSGGIDNCLGDLMPHVEVQI